MRYRKEIEFDRPLSAGTNGSSGNDGKRIAAVLPARLHANLSRLWVPVTHWLISPCPCSDLA